MGWERWVGDHGAVLGINRYGASAPAKILFEKYGLTANAVVATVTGLLAT